MTERIPDNFLDLFLKRSSAHLATQMPDGTPQVTPVWVDYDGTYILVNASKGRLKNRNMEKRAAVALDIVDPENPFRYLAIRGKVAEITEEGAAEHIDRVARRYLGTETYPWWGPGEIRQIYKILPERVVAREFVDANIERVYPQAAQKA